MGGSAIQDKFQNANFGMGILINTVWFAWNLLRGGQVLNIIKDVCEMINVLISFIVAMYIYLFIFCFEKCGFSYSFF